MIIDRCPLCGGEIIGDGYSTVEHCENAPEWMYEYHEPDSGPVLCRVVDPDD